MPSGFPSAIRAGDAGPPGTRAPQRLVQQRPSAVTHARVWAVALSLAATRAISVDFSSSGYLDVSVPRVASSRPIWFRRGWAGMTPPGFPHSEIRGSKAVCASPRLIAACHVLRRLPMPRHPPCALSIFIVQNSKSMSTWVSYHSRSLHANHTSDFSRIEESSDDSKYLYTLCNFQGARPADAGPRENPRSRILRWESAARPAR